MTKEIVAGILGVLSVAGGGFGAHEYLTSTFADKESVELAGAQVQFVLDEQIASLVSQIAVLEKKRNKSPEEINQLDYLRKRLEHVRAVQRGKAK
jgi:methionine-rich copper-binding protein CopC